MIPTFTQNLIIFAQTEKINISHKSTLASSNLIKQGSPYQGSQSAPITIIDFSDLQCIGCKRFVDNTEQQINSTYVQTGKVLLVFKHLPNRGFDSTPAAIAAQCTARKWGYKNINIPVMSQNNVHFLNS